MNKWINIEKKNNEKISNDSFTVLLIKLESSFSLQKWEMWSKDNGYDIGDLVL